jgi:hypothetical protein
LAANVRGGPFRSFVRSVLAPPGDGLDIAAWIGEADWGSVPAWFGSLSTFVAILGLRLAWRSERRDNDKLREEQLQRESDRRQEHFRIRAEAASQIVLTVGGWFSVDDDRESVERRMDVQNFGEQPVFRLSLIHRRDDGQAIASSGLVDTFRGRENQTFWLVEPRSAVANDLSRFELHFTDHHGLSWVRRADGGLEGVQEFAHRIELEDWERKETEES